MKIRTKIIISLLILVLVSVIYFLPEQVISVSGRSLYNDDFGYNMVGEDVVLENYGTIDIDETQKHGYGYIKNQEKEQQKFGLIEFDNKTCNSVFINRVKTRFSTNDIKIHKTSGISYAVINGEQIYIENTGISEVIGFNGNIDIAIVVNLAGVLDSVIYLSSKETPAYINKIKKADYFNRFSALQSDKQHTIDAVSGATITSVATVMAVNEIFMLSQRKILDDYISGISGNFNVTARLNKIWIINLVLLVLVFTLLNFEKFRKRKILTIISIFTIAWLGFYLNSSFTYLLFVKSFTNASLSIFTIAYILIILGSTVWSKNTYCKFICPFGNAQKLMYKISPFKNRITIFKNKHLKITRYIVSIIVVAGYLSGFEILSEYELFPYFFSINTSYLMFGISVLVMLISMRIPNLWCRALCPTGCVLDTVSDISENRLRIPFRKKNE